jgi:hypothetical protein
MGPKPGRSAAKAAQDDQIDPVCMTSFLTTALTQTFRNSPVFYRQHGLKENGSQELGRAQ